MFPSPFTPLAAVQGRRKSKDSKSISGGELEGHGFSEAQQPVEGMDGGLISRSQLGRPDPSCVFANHPKSSLGSPGAEGGKTARWGRFRKEALLKR